MPLVLGVDSSTQSTKVEVRDADSGRLMGHAWAPHPATLLFGAIFLAMIWVPVEYLRRRGWIVRA